MHDAVASDAGRAEVEMLERDEAGQRRQARVRDPGPVNVQLAQRRQPREVREALVADPPGLREMQLAQAREAR